MLEVRSVNKILVTLSLLSVKFHRYRTSDFIVMNDFVEVQIFLSPMLKYVNIQRSLISWH